MWPNTHPNLDSKASHGQKSTIFENTLVCISEGACNPEGTRKIGPNQECVCVKPKITCTSVGVTHGSCYASGVGHCGSHCGIKICVNSIYALAICNKPEKYPCDRSNNPVSGHSCIEGTC